MNVGEKDKISKKKAWTNSNRTRRYDWSKKICSRKMGKKGVVTNLKKNNNCKTSRYI